MSFSECCAAIIHTGNTDDTELVPLRVGSCEQKYELEPQSQICFQSSMDWTQVEGGINAR